MKAVSTHEAQNFVRECGMQMRGTRVGLGSSAPRGLIAVSTEGMDGITSFDLARFFAAHLAESESVLFSIHAREPFSQAEESDLFDAFVSSNGQSPSDHLLFSKGESEQLAICLSLGWLFRWDFGVVASGAEFAAEHTHDRGMTVHRATTEFVSAAQKLGLKKPTSQP